MRSQGEKKKLKGTRGIARYGEDLVLHAMAIQWLVVLRYRVPHRTWVSREKIALLGRSSRLADSLKLHDGVVGVVNWGSLGLHNRVVGVADCKSLCRVLLPAVHQRSRLLLLCS